MFHCPEKYRLTIGTGATNKESFGQNGVFYIPRKKKALGFMREIMTGQFQVIASDLRGFERISIAVTDNSKKKFLQSAPSLDEIRMIRDLFWDREDIIAQFFYQVNGNTRPWVVHLCRRIGSIYEVPNE